MMATILPILAAGRGDLSGKDRENASTTQLLSTSNYEMNLHLWNIKDGSIWKMAGDLEMKATNIASAISGVVCIGFPDARRRELADEEQDGDNPDNYEEPVEEVVEEPAALGYDPENRFDCLAFGIRLDTEANPLEDPVLVAAVIDSYVSDGATINPAERINDTSVDEQTDPAKSWTIVPERMTKECTKGSKKDKVTCKSINIGFMRYFETDNAEQDLQFSVDQKDTDFRVYGAIADRGGSKIISDNNVDAIQYIRAVSRIYINALEAKTDAEKDLEEKNNEKEETADSAFTGLVSMSTTLVAGILAIAF